MIPDAVMNPDTTGCDSRLARCPKRSRPMPISIIPDSRAMAIAALA
jgi:hypothetical protein